MSAAVKEIGVTCYGQTTSGYKVPIGSSVNWLLSLEDPITRESFDLTGCAVILALSQLDTLRQPLRPPLISRQATPVSGATVSALWQPADTVPGGVAFDPGLYGLEVWIEDVNGDRLMDLLFGICELTPAGRLPDDPVDPLPGVSPIATLGSAVATFDGSSATAVATWIDPGVAFRIVASLPATADVEEIQAQIVASTTTSATFRANKPFIGEIAVALVPT